MMKAAYENDPELLFFVQSDTPNQLSYADLKEIKSPLSLDELKTALTKQVISKTDVAEVQKDLTYLLRRDKHNLSRQGYANALDAGFTCAELEKKKPKELRQFYSANTFDSPRKTNSSEEKETALQNQSQERAACFDELKTNTNNTVQDLDNVGLTDKHSYKSLQKPN
ncbi:hypothetical protein [Vibrio vulnificus]|nr:hypothetical protein [Vibrio vulnificus]MBN8105523.1 hypothetical protein [Vibrio vulnificus]